MWLTKFLCVITGVAFAWKILVPVSFAGAQDSTIFWKAFEKTLDQYPVDRVRLLEFNETIQEELEVAAALHQQHQMAKWENQRFTDHEKVFQKVSQHSAWIVTLNTYLPTFLTLQAMKQAWAQSKPPIRKWFKKLGWFPAKEKKALDPEVPLSHFLPPDDTKIQWIKLVSNTHTLVMGGAALGIAFTVGGALLPLTVALPIALFKGALVYGILEHLGQSKPTETRHQWVNLQEQSPLFVQMSEVFLTSGASYVVGGYEDVGTPLVNAMGFDPFSPLGVVQVNTSNLLRDHWIGTDSQPEVKVVFERAFAKGLAQVIEKKLVDLAQFKALAKLQMQEEAGELGPFEVEDPENQGRAQVALEKIDAMERKLNAFAEQARHLFERREISLKAQIRNRGSAWYRKLRTLGAHLRVRNRGRNQEDYQALLKEAEPIIERELEKQTQESQRLLVNYERQNFFCPQVTHSLNSVEEPEVDELLENRAKKIYLQSYQLMHQFKVHQKINDILFTHVASEYLKLGRSLSSNLWIEYFQLGADLREAPQIFYYFSDPSGTLQEPRLALNSFYQEVRRVSDELGRKDKILYYFMKRVILLKRGTPYLKKSEYPPLSSSDWMSSGLEQVFGSRDSM